MVKIEINGQELEVRKGSMLIEAADESGITIPRFCYHKKLSVAANCRMCLVDVEKVAKPLPACATPVTEGMKVFTRSAKALEAQRSVMEFLLINHPLDCPICDQGGECDLQDLAMGYGNDLSRYTENKRIVADKNLGSLIATEMTRCIHCTRCVRFGQEIAGMMELGATGRGEHTRIGTYVEQTVNSEMSGNVIDLCPVGALTAKPSRYHGRPWENKQVASVASHDCIGSNIHFETRRNKVMRVVPRENEDINEVWLSDRDRFSYTALESNERITSPLIKQGEVWKEVDWQTALYFAIEGLKLVNEQKSADQIAALISPSATLEEHYLLQKLLRGLGSNNIDHRLRQLDFSDQDNDDVAPSLAVSISDLENMNAILMVGSWIRKDQPIASHRIRKAAMSGADVMVLNPLDYDFNFPIAASIITPPDAMPTQLSGIASALAEQSRSEITDSESELIKNVSVSEEHKVIANSLLAAEKGIVILGSQAHYQYEYSSLRALSSLIAKLSGVSLGFLTEGANTAGACIAGCLPHRTTAGAAVDLAGKHALDIIKEKMAAYVLFSVEPEFDCALPGLATEAINEADFVISLNSFVNESIKATADVILPIALNAETSGTYINAEGTWQSFDAAVTPLGDTKPGWKVLRVLGNLFDMNGFDYVTSDDVLNEVKSMARISSTATTATYSTGSLPSESNGTLQRVGYLPIYTVDGQLRRAQPLQDTTDVMQAAGYISSNTANKIGVDENERIDVNQENGTAQLQVVFDEGVPDNCMFIPMGVPGVEKLGAGFGAIELVRGNS